MCLLMCVQNQVHLDFFFCWSTNLEGMALKGRDLQFCDLQCQEGENLSGFSIQSSG